MGMLSFLMDLYENLRPTTSDKKDNKSRNYSYKSDFLGEKKYDCRISKDKTDSIVDEAVKELKSVDDDLEK